MSRLPMFLILALAATVSLAGEVYQTPKEVQGYLDGLDLPYVESQATQVEARALKSKPGADKGEITPEALQATINGDFNGDGKADFAGLYSYTGSEYRGENLHLDLIIVFTEDEVLKHKIFQYAARRSADGKRILATLTPRSPGRIEEVDGEFTLKMPAIQLDQLNKGYSTFYYWNGEDFAVVTTED